MPSLLTVPMFLAAAMASGSPPPPGYYEVSTQTPFENGDVRVELSQDGATGSDTMRQAGRGVIAHAEGSGPVTACVGNGPPPAQLAGLPSLPTRIRYTRLDATRWQVDYEVTLAAPGATPVRSMSPLLAAARAHAATPEERRKIDELAASLPEMQRQQSAAMAQTRARMAEELKTASPEEAAQIRAAMAAFDGAPSSQRTQRGTQIYRRIGDHCAQ